MDKISRDQFLDNGWYTEASIYYNNYIYWFEGYINSDGKFEFFINKFKVNIIIKNKKKYYSILLDKNKCVIDGSIIYKNVSESEDDVKILWMKEPIFDGKKFWEVEHELEWIEDDCEPTII